MDPLISPDALAHLLFDAAESAPTVLDVRWRMTGPPGDESYRVGHVPGAVRLDLDTELAAPHGEGGRHPLPDALTLQRTLRAAGVRGDRGVVAYDDADGSVAARAWWLLRWAGHQAVAVLDGGYAGWLAEGHSISTDLPDPQRGDIVVRPGAMPVLDADAAARLARDGLLLDARAPERYAGDREPVDPRAGHVPGAVSAPTLSNVGVDGRFLPSEMLRARFAKLGATDAAEVGAYCGSGVTAAHEILALTLAGVPAALYVGSWSDWISDTARPIVTGGR